jgi:hypothetical protein
LQKPFFGGYCQSVPYPVGVKEQKVAIFFLFDCSFKENLKKLPKNREKCYF